MIFLIPLLLFISLSTTTVSAQEKPTINFNAICKEAYQLVLSLQFEKGQQLIHQEQAKQPNNIVPDYIELYVYCLKAYLDETRKSYDAYYKQKREVESKLKNVAGGNAYQDFFKGDIAMQSAFIKLKHKQFASAAIDLNRAYTLISSNEKRYPDFILNKRNLSLLHAIIGTIPNDYKWLLKFASFSGTVLEAKLESTLFLLKTIEDNTWQHYRSDALIIYSFLDINFSIDDNTFQQLSTYYSYSVFKQLYQKNPLVLNTRIMLAFARKENDIAISLLNTYRFDAGYYQWHYLDYLLGKAKIQRNDHDANLPLIRFLTNFKGRSNRKAAYQKLAWHFLINNRSDLYTYYLQKIPNTGDLLMDHDRLAQKEAESDEVPNIFLLQARLLSDGGYYSKALASLDRGVQNAAWRNSRESLEYQYRYARILHDKKEIDAAIVSYKKVIKEGEKFPYYFAANSSLQLGQIYESKGDNATARHYYQQCLNMDFSEYRNSITQKAKAGLGRTK
ncbi:MAG: hypothetical protein RQ866_08310 [Bacteroidales bacterium]|nr:hypothetical protein [Bacteroidales bacterium]